METGDRKGKEVKQIVKPSKTPQKGTLASLPMGPWRVDLLSALSQLTGATREM